jgi:hypothetical protein
MIGTCNSAGNGIDMAWPYTSSIWRSFPQKYLQQCCPQRRQHVPLLRLNDKTAKTVPGATDQMLLWDTAAETYSYAPVPAGGGAALPYYALPTKIALEDRSNPADTRAVYVDGSSLLVRPTSTLSHRLTVTLSRLRITVLPLVVTGQQHSSQLSNEVVWSSVVDRLWIDRTSPYLRWCFKVKGAPLRVDWKAPTYASWPATNFASVVIGSLLGTLDRFSTFH